MSKSLIEQITDKENMYRAFTRALKGDNKYCKDAIRFCRNETWNLLKLREKLLGGAYEFKGYTRFLVYEPKERVIHAPFFEDKIVQLAIDQIIRPIYQRTFIYHSYACLDNKGTHRAVDYVQRSLRRGVWQYGDKACILKIDIRKFFYSIDREILKQLLPKVIRCKATLELLYTIIDSAKLIDSVGLPLGNTLSHLLSNIILHEVDVYCKRELGIKFYVRYADDIIIVTDSKESAREYRDLIEIKLNQLNLYYNEKKTKIFPTQQGVNAYGYKIYTTHRLLRDDSKKKIKRKTKKIPRLLLEGEMSIQTAEQILNSWLGHAGHGNSLNFILNLLEKREYIGVSSKGTLYIKSEVLLC